jgi:RNA polymerase sigma-70 factor (ECF subfamily)
MAGERVEHSLQTTALIHEAYLRLVGPSPVDWESRGHFFAVAARVMRRILVDHARARRSLKRGGEGRPVSLDEGSPQTVLRDWKLAKVWLLREMKRGESQASGPTEEP